MDDTVVRRAGTKCAFFQEIRYPGEFDKTRYKFLEEVGFERYYSANPAFVKELIDLIKKVTIGNIDYTPEPHWWMEALRDLVKPRQVLYRATTNPNNGTPLLFFFPIDRIYDSSTSLT
ncbi:hypothetical protein PRIPAC_80559 [Pristionchus pacificus]|uniref:Uncharacterized protein n=1 Tax=Pristionchus pacificus TaxID=54126 RepID=A0A2A6CLT7_PRIPA|nr:hypothetical protein PRIPAC_80559 [Pristionchus pacificus]|eukprot:PDM79069.1 hypothetical protein PRIPAC_31648 [Pristionchus pacificus]